MGGGGEGTQNDASHQISLLQYNLTIQSSTPTLKGVMPAMRGEGLGEVEEQLAQAILVRVHQGQTMPPIGQAEQKEQVMEGHPSVMLRGLDLEELHADK